MNNMGNISRKEAEAFFTNVIKRLEYEFGEKEKPAMDWRMEWCTDGSICIRDRKLVLIHTHNVRFRIYHGYPWQLKEDILHEIAHIFTCDKVHGEAFYNIYTKLLIEFMVVRPL